MPRHSPQEAVFAFHGIKRPSLLPHRVRLFGPFLRIRNILMSFDEFDGMQLLSEYACQNYAGRENDLYK